MDAVAAQPQGQLAAYVVRTFLGSHVPEGYIANVYSKWLRSLRHGNDYFRLIQPAGSYYTQYRRYIASVLARADCVVHIAVLADDHDVILGFSVSHGNVLDYVHVHKDNRRLGIGTKLIPAGVDTITHLTKTGLTIWANKHSHLRFNPFA